MAQIAVDVVLLPSDEVMDLAIEVNKQFLKDIENEIALDKKTCLPHVTLLMGVIEENQVRDVEKKLQEIAKRFSPLELSIPSVKVTDKPDGSRMSSFVIDKTAELARLHETAVTQLIPPFTYDKVTMDMFYSPPPANERTLRWVEDFATKSVHENYQPHITLGMGVPEAVTFPIKFTASKLALCHLGNYCTCRKILVSSGFGN